MWWTGNIIFKKIKKKRERDQDGGLSVQCIKYAYLSPTVFGKDG